MIRNGGEGLDLSESGDNLSIQEVLVPIWGNRKKIIAFTVIVTLITVIINYFFLPHYYKAVATLLPETEKSKLSALGQFADVAKLAGVNVPGSEIARLYPSIVTSETILRSVIAQKFVSKEFPQPVDLVQYFELDDPSPEYNMDGALKRLRELLNTSFDGKTSIVSVSLEMKEPQLAADVLNAIVSELDGFMRLKKLTNASEQVKWIETRLREVEPELRKAEDTLKIFREKNRRVADSPQLLMVQERLAREVQIRSAIVVELKKQFELAKLEEIKNITIVNILDPARPPIKKDRPKRVVNTLLMFALALLFSSGYYSIRSVYGERISAFVRNVRG